MEDNKTHAPGPGLPAGALIWWPPSVQQRLPALSESRGPAREPHEAV